MEPDYEAELEAIAENPFEHLDILRYFKFSHLKNEKLQKVSKEFARMALFIVYNTPGIPERTVALRKLLESKDAAVRAAL